MMTEKRKRSINFKHKVKVTSPQVNSIFDYAETIAFDVLSSSKNPRNVFYDAKPRNLNRLPEISSPSFGQRRLTIPVQSRNEM